MNNWCEKPTVGLSLYQFNKQSRDASVEKDWKRFYHPIYGICYSISLPIFEPSSRIGGGGASGIKIAVNFSHTIAIETTQPETAYYDYYDENQDTSDDTG